MDTIITASAQETAAFATAVAQILKAGDILNLHGDLGAGKTTFTKALAAALGVTSVVRSPTFTLMNVMRASSGEINTLVHIDTYRLKDVDELISIGVQDYLGKKNTIAVVEWPEKIEPLLAGHAVKNIYFEHGDNETRKIQKDF